jgi:hypothetical protein
LIGPVRLFDFGAYYHPLLYWMIGGAVVPFVTWLILRRWPQCWLRYFHLPIALTGLEFVPPASGINFSSSLIVGFIFREFFVFRFAPLTTVRFDVLSPDRRIPCPEDQL